MHSDPSTLVTVIVPIYNVEKYLEQCLSSIASQTHKSLEVLCINDGSTDSSRSIAERFASNDKRFTVISKRNEGYGASCNLGIERARGKWISIIEPDDWIDPAMYEDMLSLAGRFKEEVDVVKTPWIEVRFWDNPKTQAERPCTIYRRMETSTKPFTIKDSPVLLETHPSIWSALYRKDFLDEKSIRFIPYPGAGWADNPFLIESLCQASSILYLDAPYYHYRFDLPGSTLNHQSDEAIARPFDRWIDMMRILDELGIDDRGVLEAHHVRGFDYVAGAIYDDGWGNPLVQSKTREVFEMMDESIVVECPRINMRKKRLFFKVMGRPAPRLFRLARVKFLASETIHLLKIYGIKPIIEHSSFRLPSEA
ncbi:MULTISPECIES: glycosyltransferase [unclassified Adlercreutzia]|uniref:glycosyltransferase n=1 Tax=unclassified Adlercreutzia TaxID=2636013 RepID=UPI0013ED6060|nr:MULTISPECIES: glycosyltransferase [unclassified Adlercreutzia]